jgi:hypothetical protein
MRHSVPKAIALGLLSVYILHSSGKPIVPFAPCIDLACRDIFEKAKWTTVAHAENPPSAFDRRASGGGRPKNPNENSSNSPQANPNDPNNPSGAGEQQGESGGFSETPETEGGFSDSQETEGGFSENGADTNNPDSDAQPANSNPAPNAPVANNPGSQNAVQYAPSVRNNHNQPAASSDNPFIPSNAPVAVINVAARRNEFQATITNLNLNNKPWFFYSGFVDRKRAPQFQLGLEHKLGLGNGMSSMNDVLPLVQDVKPGQTSYMTEYWDYEKKQEFHGAGDYYWAANSKAYGQAIAGDMYAVIPSGRSVNQPYPNKGSNWWTYELPELTRNPNVNSITVAPMAEDMNFMSVDVDKALYFGPPIQIWRQGDEPIGFPASEFHHLLRPNEAWEELPDIDIPDSK